jgi:hypothetical protein
LESTSECLVTLPASRVIAAAADMLGLPATRAPASNASHETAVVDTSALERRRPA